MKKLTVVFWAANLSFAATAQDTIRENKPSFSWLIFADAYYSYDFNKPTDHLKPSFLYNHNRHNEVNLNIGLIQASYSNERIRGNLGLMAGTYPQYNYAAEQPLLQHVFQANAGVKISRRHSLWMDAGILPSHIGYETAISTDNWTLTRSIMAENSPYFEAGARLSYTSNNGQWFLSGLVLNGWQRIQRADGNQTPAFGTQVTYTPNANTTVNWSTFAGNEFPDTAKRWRYFSNVYTVLQLSGKIGFTAAFDIGFQQAKPGSSNMQIWYTPNAVIRYAINDHWAVAARAEYYSDKNSVIITSSTANGFQTFGASLNVDRKVGQYFWWRTEIRSLNARDALFLRKGAAVNNDWFLSTSFAIKF